MWAAASSIAALVSANASAATTYSASGGAPDAAAGTVCLTVQTGAGAPNVASVQIFVIYGATSAPRSR